MSQISRKWIEENAIDNTRIDNSLGFTFNGVTTNDLLLVNADATVNGNLDVNGEIQSDTFVNTGDMDISGGLDIAGLLRAYGDASVVGLLSVQGDASITNLLRTDDLLVLKDTTVNDDLHVHGELTVDSTSYFLNDASVSNNLRVINDETVNNNLRVDGTVSIGPGTVLIDGTGISCSSNFLITAPQTTVEGPVILNDSLRTVRDATIGTTLDVDGQLNANSTSVFTGDMTANGEIDANSNVDIAGTLNVDGKIDANDAVEIDGLLTANGDTHLIQDATVNGLLYANGGLEVVSGATISGGLTSDSISCAGVLSTATLSVSGVSTFTGVATFEDATVNGNLDANNIVISSATFTNLIADDATINNNIDVDGAVYGGAFSGTSLTLTSAGAINASNASGTSIIEHNLSVSKEIYSGDDLTIGKDLKGTGGVSSIGISDFPIGNIYVSSNKHLYFKSSYNIYDSTAGASRIYIDSAGRSAINNTNPSLFDSNADDLIVTNSGSISNSGISIYSAQTGSGNLYFADDGGDSTDFYMGYVKYDHATDKMSLGTDSTPRILITNQGAVNINRDAPGVDSDASTLVVTRPGSLGGGNVGITILSGQTMSGNLYFADDGAEAYHNYAGYVKYDQNTSKMTFGTSGSVRAALNSTGLAINNDSAELRFDAYEDQNSSNVITGRFMNINADDNNKNSALISQVDSADATTNLYLTAHGTGQVTMANNSTAPGVMIDSNNRVAINSFDAGVQFYVEEEQSSPNVITSHFMNVDDSDTTNKNSILVSQKVSSDTTTNLYLTAHGTGQVTMANNSTAPGVMIDSSNRIAINNYSADVRFAAFEDQSGSLTSIVGAFRNKGDADQGASIIIGNNYTNDVNDYGSIIYSDSTIYIAPTNTSPWSGGAYATFDSSSFNVHNGMAKSFVIDHPNPLKSSKQLKHACIEGPENAVFYRGHSKLIEGSVKVNLPDYFCYLVDEDSVTVSLTCYKGSSDLYVDSLYENSFCVKTNTGKSDQEFYWTVMATRKDIAPLVVESDKKI